MARTVANPLTEEVPGKEVPATDDTPTIAAKSLRGVLRTYTVETLCETGQEFFLYGVQLGTSNRKTRDGQPEEIATIRLRAMDGDELGTVIVARASIIEQLERAGLDKEAPDQLLGPVKVVKQGRSYLLQPTD